MRTSNKILLIFFLSAIGIFGAVHLALYARFSRGEISTGKGTGSGIVTSYNGSAPSTLFLKGRLNVSIHPSDSFSMEWEKNIDGNVIWRKVGDSLIVEGTTPGQLNPFDERISQEVPALTIYYGRLQHIGLSGCVARIDGTKDSIADLNPFAPRLRLQDAKLIVGGYFESNGNIQTGPPREYYDSLHIDATSSNIVIQQNASIGDLNVSLGNQSRLQDEKARIARPEIHYSDDSWLDVRGSDLRNSK